jgi:hypothetical protein
MRFQVLDTVRYYLSLSRRERKFNRGKRAESEQVVSYVG